MLKKLGKLLFLLFRKLFQKKKETNNNPETVIGVGIDLQAKEKKLTNIVLPDSARKGQFWCFGTNRVGKAQSNDSLIHTPDGWKRMGDIKKGDTVSTPDNKKATVIDIFPQGILPIYKITFEDGRSAEASGDHLWEIHHPHWTGKYKKGVSRAGIAKPRILTTLELKSQIERNKGRFAVRLIAPIEKPKQDLPVHPYVLGCLLGDGNISKNSHGMCRLSFCCSSPSVVKRLNKFLPYGTIIEQVGPRDIDYAIKMTDDLQKHGRNKTCGYAVNPVRKKLAELKLSGLRSWEKFIPEQYLESNVDDRLELLRGLLDTDGTVTKTGTLQFDTSSKQLAIGFQRLVWSLGGVAKIKTKINMSYVKNGVRVQCRDSYHITISRYPEPRELVTRPERKNRLPVNYRYKTYLKNAVKSVEFSRNAEARCILLDSENHLYITDNYIVTHNTRVMENMIEQDIKKGYSVVVIDPKGDIELFNKIIQAAAMTKRLDDISFITPIFPEYSAVINPLSSYYMPEEIVGHIVSGVETGKEPYFFNVAYEISLVLVQSLELIAHSQGKEPDFNLLKIKNYISREELEKLKAQELDKLTQRNIEYAYQYSMDLQKILDSPQDYYSKVSSSLRVALTELTSGNIGKIIGQADENRFIKRLQEGKPVILIAHLGSLLTRKAASTLGKVLISMIQSFIGRVFSSGRVLNPPLCIYIDEAQSTLYPGIDDLFAKAGGAGVWIHGFCQSVNQMYAAIGEDYTKTILDNTNSKFFMRVPDYDTAHYISGQFGTVRKFSPILSVGGGISTREEELPLVREEDILRLQPRQFYFTSYHGLFKGTTKDTSELFVNVEFPSVHFTDNEEVAA